jgi:hypothetical protein
MKSILFKSEMVQAILEGRKTQTRRIIKPQPVSYGGFTDPHVKSGERISHVHADGMKEIKPKYKVGEVIYVKERYRFFSPLGEPEVIRAIEYINRTERVTIFKPPLEDDEGCMISPFGKYRNAMFMPEFASRLKLEIVAVRPEFLKDISDSDCQAESVSESILLKSFVFQILWDSINGKGAFEKNPLVWVYEFKVVQYG